jgi:hypothetical protein
MIHENKFWEILIIVNLTFFSDNFYFPKIPACISHPDFLTWILVKMFK